MASCSLVFVATITEIGLTAYLSANNDVVRINRCVAWIFGNVAVLLNENDFIEYAGGYADFVLMFNVARNVEIGTPCCSGDLNC